MIRHKNTKLTKKDYLKYYEPYLEQLETAKKFISYNDNSNFDASNLALLYKHLIDYMPDKCPDKYNLEHYTGLDIKGSYQGRFYLSKYKGYPMLYILEANEESSSDDSGNIKYFHDDNTANEMLKHYKHSRTWWILYSNSFFISAILVIIFGVCSLSPIGSVLTGFLFILSIILVITSMILTVINGEHSDAKIHKSKAFPRDLKKGINYVINNIKTDNPLTSEYNLRVARNDYGEVVRNHYKNLSHSKYSWNSIKRSIHQKNVKRLVANTKANKEINGVKKLLDQKENSYDKD